MTVTITITDPTADESRAVRAYLDSLHAEAPYVQMTGRGARIPPLEIDTSVDLAEGFDEPQVTLSDDTGPSAADAGAPDFDSAGMPWDERIHASSRATVADGTWRKKRGVSPEEVAAVEAELLAKVAADNAAGTIPQADGSEAPSSPKDDVDNADYSEGQITEPAAPVQDRQTFVIPDGHEAVRDEDGKATGETRPVTTDAPPPPPPPAAAPNPFLAVMSRIGKSKLDKAKKDELLTAAGALDEKGNPSILVLNKRPELIDGFVALLDSEGV